MGRNAWCATSLCKARRWQPLSTSSLTRSRTPTWAPSSRACNSRGTPHGRPSCRSTCLRWFASRAAPSRCARATPCSFAHSFTSDRCCYATNRSSQPLKFACGLQLCPVDCIHCVPVKMLPVLEHVMEFCVQNEVPGRDPSRLHQVGLHAAIKPLTRPLTTGEFKSSPNVFAQRGH